VPFSVRRRRVASFPELNADVCCYRLGQRYVMPHTRTHRLMLKIGLRRCSVTEVFGQVVRILLGAVGSPVGIVPVGKSGGTDTSMFRRLPVAADIAHIVDENRGPADTRPRSKNRIVLADRRLSFRCQWPDAISSSMSVSAAGEVSIASWPAAISRQPQSGCPRSCSRIPASGAYQGSVTAI
jgi:hypothetical protein